MALALPARATRRLIMQKARSHPGRGSCSLRAHGFRFCFTPPTVVLCAYPSQYFSAIGSCLAFSLGSWSTRIPAGFPVPRRTQDSARVRPVSDTRLSRATARLSMRFSYLSVFTNSRRSPTTPLKAVWAHPRSLAATWGISIDFFSRVT